MIKDDNKGFTLVELMIGIAIASAVMVGLIVLISSSSKSFSTTSQEVNLQIEAQTTMNSISDMLIEATTVKVYPHGTLGDKIVLITAADSVTENVGGASQVNTKDVVHVIINDVSEQKLYYTKKVANPTGGTSFDVNDSAQASAAADSILGLSGDNKEEYLFGNYVQSFDVEPPDDTARIKVVKVKIKFKVGSKEYEVRNDIKLRNGKSSTKAETATPSPVGP